MKLGYKLILFLLIGSLVIAETFNENEPVNNTTKPSLEIPDVIVKANDQSQLNIIQKEEISIVEVDYQKEVPTIEKLDLAVLFYEKNLLTEVATTINNFYNEVSLGFSNIHPLAFKFLHGQSLASQNYLIEASRLSRSDYIKNSQGRSDKISIDYNRKLSSQEKLDLSVDYNYLEYDLPSSNGQKRGEQKLNYFPIVLSYEKQFSSENIQGKANFSWATDQKSQDSFSGLLFNYQKKLSKEQQLRALVDLNNSASKLSLSLQQDKLWLERIQGEIGLDYNFSPSDTLFTLTAQSNYFWDSWGLSVGYRPYIAKKNYETLYLQDSYREINADLKKEIYDSNLFLKVDHSISQQLKFDLEFHSAEVRRAHFLYDKNKNGLLETLNTNKAQELATDFNLDYQFFSEYSTKINLQILQRQIKNNKEFPLIYPLRISNSWLFAPLKNDFSFSVNLSYFSQTKDVLGTKKNLKEFFLTDLQFKKIFSDYFSLNLYLNNIFNTKYSRRSDFKEPGRELLIKGSILF